MSSNTILPLVAVFTLSVGASVALAQSDTSAADQAAPAKTDAQTTAPKKKKQKKHTNKTELDKAERGNPHSVIYKSRKSSAPNPTKEQIQAGESGNPASVDYANRPTSTHNPTNAEINAAEKGNPEAVPEK